MSLRTRSSHFVPCSCEFNHLDSRHGSELARPLSGRHSDLELTAYHPPSVMASPPSGNVVGSQPCGGHAGASLPVAGFGRADWLFGCSLSLSISSGIAIVVYILYYSTKKLRSHHDRRTRVHGVNRVTDIRETCTLYTHMGYSHIRFGVPMDLLVSKSPPSQLGTQPGPGPTTPLQCVL